MPRIIKSAKGTFSTADVTIDSSGRVVSASTGQAGGALDVVRLFDDQAGNGTYTANPGANNMSAFLKGGGGGGGGRNNSIPDTAGRNGRRGGFGGFGYYFQPVSGGTSYNYTVGDSGNGGNQGQTGQAGSATNITNLATVNGGAGGGPGGGSVGDHGQAPGAATDLNANVPSTGGTNVIHSTAGSGGTGGTASPASGTSGTSGFILVYDNSGT
ncbi:hypothetical protein [Hyphomonas sp.]|uniref:glycine-rich domain-containing protein n=1 Tax=Hyphomonas sp. TaxID=87 RepID=UPI0025C45A46|nr:hypothetical protein [Hyphomonas sp.]|tara:strand:+ start:54 stop:692 length:639 start_codon:yes stop_codon:yes gene_type:complete